MQRAPPVPGMARSAALLLWAQALGLAGAQPSQLILTPPWMTVFTEEEVTLRSRAESIIYRCRSPGASLSPPITLTFSEDWLVLQVPAQTLLEGDTLRLRCRGWKDKGITQVLFYREWKLLGRPSQGTELRLPTLQLHHSGRYHCEATVRHIIAQWRRSVLVPVVVEELFSVPVLRLEGPAEPPEGAPLTLGCLSRLSPLRPLTRLQHVFYQDKVVVGGPQDSPQLLLPAVELSHSGNYSCEVRTEMTSVQKHSTPVTITVHRVPVSGVSLVVQPPEGEVAEGDRLVLGCSVAAGTGPLSFSWHRQGSAVPLATGPRYELRAVRQRDGGRYHCRATNGDTGADSPPLWVSVLVPVAGVAIAMERMEPSVPAGESLNPGCWVQAGESLNLSCLVQAGESFNPSCSVPAGESLNLSCSVPAGESLNLSCSVQAGTAPVTFTWLRDGQELSWGPVLSLGTVDPAHAGTYHCLATNRLGTHRTFRACSPALALSVTQPKWGLRQQSTAIATGLSVSLLLLLAAAMAWHLQRRHHTAARKSRVRDPTASPEPEGRWPEPTAPPGAPGDGEVLYAQVTVAELGGGKGGGGGGGWDTPPTRVTAASTGPRMGFSFRKFPVPVPPLRPPPGVTRHLRGAAGSPRAAAAAERHLRERPVTSAGRWGCHCTGCPALPIPSPLAPRSWGGWRSCFHGISLKIQVFWLNRKKWWFSSPGVPPPPRNACQQRPGASATVPSPTVSLAPSSSDGGTVPGGSPGGPCPQQTVALSLSGAQPCWQSVPASPFPALPPSLQKPSYPVCTCCCFTRQGGVRIRSGGQHPPVQGSFSTPQAQGVRAQREAVQGQTQPFPGGKSFISPSQSQEGGAEGGRGGPLSCWGQRGG
ncbi:Fc receptor-like protein 3 [Tyto alba]|uniref:Fc receptor-like protein 3 n=1 Tax=Tyto alba TaxID=56313 RepID=UPI001C681F21|nr:Fc receptor-like protein 3 [Tyto alba]